MRIDDDEDENHHEQEQEQPNLYYRTKSASLDESFQHIVTPVTETTASPGPTPRRRPTAMTTTRTAVAVSDAERTTMSHYDAATSFSVHHTTPQEAEELFEYYDDNDHHPHDDADDADDDAGIFDLEL